MTNLTPLSNKIAANKLILTASIRGNYAAIPGIIATLKEGLLSPDQIGQIQTLISSASSLSSPRDRVDLSNKLSLVLDPKAPGFAIASDLIQQVLAFLKPSEIVGCRKIHRSFNAEISDALTMQLSGMTTYTREVDKTYMNALKKSLDEALAIPRRIEVVDFRRGVRENALEFLGKKHADTVTHLYPPNWADQEFLDTCGRAFSKISPS